MKQAYKGILLIVLIIVTVQVMYFVNSPAKPAQEQGSRVFLENFETVDLYGAAVGDEIFTGYDMTMVYVWGTF